MADLRYADRVRETSTTTGTGTMSLNGASSGYQTFVDGIGDLKEVIYMIDGGSEWEIGRGTVTDSVPDLLSRATVLASSNAGALVNFSAGSKVCFCTHPALVTQYGMIGGARQDATLANSVATATLMQLVFDVFPYDSESLLGTNRFTFPATWNGLYAQATLRAEILLALGTDVRIEIEHYDVSNVTKGLWFSAWRSPNATWDPAGVIQTPPVQIVTGDYFLARAGHTSGVNRDVRAAFWCKSLGTV